MINKKKLLPERKSCEHCSRDWWYIKQLNDYDKGKPAVKFNGEWLGPFCLDQHHKTTIENLKRSEKEDKKRRELMSIKEDETFADCFFASDSTKYYQESLTLVEHKMKELERMKSY